MISTHISRASALLLGAIGLILLFASDAILPYFMPAFPASAAWIGEVLAASLLALAMLNWMSQSALLGGIYARPIVMCNSMFYFVTTTVLFRVALRPDTPASLWCIVIPVAGMAGMYAWLLFRGPMQRDFEKQRMGL